MKYWLTNIIVIILFLSVNGCGKKETTTTGAKSPTTTAAKPTEAQRATDTSGDCIVARVGEEEIRLSEVYAITKTLEDNIYLVGNFTREELVEKTRNRHLDKLIESKLLLLEAKREGIEVPEADFRKGCKQMRESIGDEAAFAKYLAEQGKTEEEFYAEVKERMLMGLLLYKNVESRIAVTDNECLEYFENHKKDQFTVPDRTHVRRIEIKDQPDKPLSLEEAEKKIKEIRAQLEDMLARETDPKKRLEIFSEFARKYSHGTNAAGGGYVVLYGRDAKGELDQSFVDAAFETEIGQLSPIHRIHNTGEGYCFLMVESRTASRVAPYDDTMKQQVKSILLKEKKEKLHKEFLEQIRERFKVTKYPDCLRKSI